MYLFQAADKIKIVFNPSVAVFIGKTNPRAENTCTEKMTLNIHWGLGIGSTNTEAASVSAQRGVLVSVHNQGLGIRTFSLGYRDLL